MKKENLFAHIDNLDELKPYICPKAVSTRDWEKVCRECKGKCDAGKQAIQILDEAAKPDIPKKAGGPEIVTARMLAGRDAWNEKQHENTLALARETFTKAVKDNCNPAEILAGITDTDVTMTRKRIDYWIKKYPDLDKELNMKAIMDRYVKRRKSHKEKPDKAIKAIPGEMIPGPDMDEISIGDILKAADEGHLKTDSVEETENGVEVHASVEPGEDVPFHEGDSWIDPETIAKDFGNGGFTVDNPFPCEAAPVPFSPCQMFPDGKGSFYTVGDTSEAATDNVNRPGHYTFGAIEVIDYIRDKMTSEMFQGFCMGNVLKYVSRHKHKNGVEDLKKANVYLGWLIESEEGAE